MSDHARHLRGDVLAFKRAELVAHDRGLGLRRLKGRERVGELRRALRDESAQAEFVQDEQKQDEKTDVDLGLPALVDRHGRHVAQVAVGPDLKKPVEFAQVRRSHHGRPLIVRVPAVREKRDRHAVDEGLGRPGEGHEADVGIERRRVTADDGVRLLHADGLEVGGVDESTRVEKLEQARGQHGRVGAAVKHGGKNAGIGEAKKRGPAEELLRIVPRAGDLALQRKPAREARRRVGSDVPARQILERVDVRPVGAGDDERAHRVRGVGRRPRLAGRDAEGLNPLLLHQIDLLGGQHQEVGLLMKHLLGRIRRDDVAP